MGKNRSLVLLFAAVVALPTPATAWADIGPKPLMEFEFVYQDLPALDIQSGTLLECADPACINGQALEQVGPQRFSCELNSCSSLAYDYAENLKLVVTFSDRVTRESNVFGKEHFRAFYRVTVSEGGMVVQEVGGVESPLQELVTAVAVGVACLFGGAMLSLVTVLVALSVRSRNRPLSFKEHTGLLLVGWLLAVPTVVLTSLFSPAIAVTVGLELGLGLLYAALRRKPRFTLFSALLLVNALTAPLLSAALMYVTLGTPGMRQGVAELVIWLVEAAAIYFTHRSAFSFREALALAFGLNATSWLVGLALPA